MADEPTRLLYDYSTSWRRGSNKSEEVKIVKKPELLVTPVTVKDIQPLIEAGADAFVIGEQRYGLRLAGEFSRESSRAVYSIGT